MKILKYLVIALSIILCVEQVNANQGVEAFNELQRQADEGDAKAQCSLAILYFQGKQLAKDNLKAIEYFTKAADQGYAMAQCYLGGIYLKGVGVEKDAKKAFEYHTKAANQGYANAQYKLGLYYKEKGDNAKALALFEKSAKQGNKLAKKELKN